MHLTYRITGLRLVQLLLLLGRASSIFAHEPLVHRQNSLPDEQDFEDFDWTSVRCLAASRVLTRA